VAVAGCGTRLPRSAFGGDPTLGSAVPGSGPSVPAASTNPGSDVGVTPTEVRVGLIVSLTSPLGAEAFSPPMYGAQALFQSLNARGGVHGRTVRVIVCDDGATGGGNLSCARKLIEGDKVFAFAGNSIFNYAAASYVSAKDVPDIGGEPVSTAYDQYQHLYSISGSSSRRDGRTVGVNGKLSGGTEVYRYFKLNLASRVAGVVFYNQSDSQRYADLTTAGLQLEGYQVVREQVDFAVPNFDAAAVDMKAHHVDTVYDALDGTGNVSLCKSMAAARLTLKAKVGTVQGWTDTVRTDFSSTPGCRNLLYATAGDRNYMDTQFPAVAQFRSDMRAAFPDREGKLSMWEEEGWASGHWLADAMSSCGANLTRACVEAFVNRPTPYTAGGILMGSDFIVNTNLTGTVRNCLNVAQWQDSGYAGRGGWVTRAPGKDFICYEVPQVVYTP
jgi:ABC-type branched-subunit amino acid transport system substrate-binding protein